MPPGHMHERIRYSIIRWVCNCRTSGELSVYYLCKLSTSLGACFRDREAPKRPHALTPLFLYSDAIRVLVSPGRFERRNGNVWGCNGVICKPYVYPFNRFHIHSYSNRCTCMALFVPLNCYASGRCASLVSLFDKEIAGESSNRKPFC